MMRRAIPAFAILIALSQTAIAGVPLFGQVSCAVVRFYVAKYSEAAAEKWARGHGATDAEIDTARRCLHGANVQTASSAAKPPVAAPAPVTEPERTHHEPAERDPGQAAMQVVAVQAQRADPEQDTRDNASGVRDFIRSKEIEDRPVEHVSYETKNDPAASDEKASALRPRHAVAMHRADRARVGHVPWLKRLWDQLTRPRQFNVAFLHFRARRF